MNFRNILSVVTGVILLFSLLSIQWEMLPNRWLRLGTAGIFTLFALTLFTIKKPLGILFFFLLVFCDFFLLLWEQPFSKAGYYSSHIIALSILTFLTIRELKRPKISVMEGLFLIFFLLINSGILFALDNHSGTGTAVEDFGLRILFYSNGLLIFLLAISAFFYSIHFANDVSAFLFLGIMGITSSDFLLFAIYFADLEELRYLDNIFYTIGFYFLLSSYNEHSQRKEEGLMIEEEKPDEEILLKE